MALNAYLPCSSLGCAMIWSGTPPCLSLASSAGPTPYLGGCEMLPLSPGYSEPVLALLCFAACFASIKKTGSNLFIVALQESLTIIFCELRNLAENSELTTEAIFINGKDDRCQPTKTSKSGDPVDGIAEALALATSRDGHSLAND